MIWLNGILCAPENAISAQDRGLLLGESVFETLLVKNQIPQFWQAHVTRLNRAVKAFDLPLGYDEAALRQGVIDLLSAHKRRERQVLRLTVTGGNGGRGLIAANDAPANTLMHLSEAALPPEALKLADSRVIRLAGNTLDLDGEAANAHKTGAYLDNILARKQALRAKADEAVMCNQYGRIACAAAGNVFAAFGNHLITPPLSEGALPGIIRAALLALENFAGWHIKESLIEAERLKQADAIFITNSVNQIVPAGYHALTADEKKQGLVLNEALPQFSEF